MKVVNIYKDTYDVYIGRPGKNNPDAEWGNPFSIGKDGTREEVLIKFKQYLWNKMESPSYCRKLYTLRGKTLGCFCKPNACHGDIYVAAIEYLDNHPFMLQDK